MSRRLEINFIFGELLSQAERNLGLKQSDLAASINIDARGFRRMKEGYVPESANVIERVRVALNISPEVMAEALGKGPDDYRRRVLQWHREGHAEVTRLARGYYRDLRPVLDLPFITKPDWLPSKPLPLREIDQRLRYQSQRDTVKARRLPILGDEAYSDLIRRVAPEIVFEDNVCYRPIDVLGNRNQPELVFSGCRYQNFVDTCEVLSFELSYWAFRNAKKLSQRNPRRNNTDLKLRGHPKDLFNLSNRNACLGICTVLLVFNRPKGDYFYVQKRSAMDWRGGADSEELARWDQWPQWSTPDRSNAAFR